ncbi:MAG: UrcA family protein [Gammaproteobacteria bacterium]|nr:UrcA family protein [Gammaproteobacteria bacterium]
MKTFAVAGLGMALSAGAAAGDFRFNYSAADLISPDHVTAMHASLEAAAGGVCRDQYPHRVRVAEKCVDVILEDAVVQIANPQLTTYQERLDKRRGS